MTGPADPLPDSGSAAADALVDAALALPPEQRSAWLRARVRQDADLAAHLAPLLADLDAGDDFLSPGGAMRGPLFEDFCSSLDEEAATPSLAPGDRVGAYEIVAAIGRGGMGEVYRARDPNLGRDVALKVLPSRWRDDPATVARLRREARLLAALNHPNIGAIYGLEESGPTAALVLEFVEGPTLADCLSAGDIPRDDIVAIARQLVDALAAARSRGIVHRDLKPANISIGLGGRVKVLDFGIASVRREDGDSSTRVPTAMAALDLPGPAGGTAAYMSPEQVRGDLVDHRTDVWAFGCVLFEMLTGRRAFEGKTLSEVLAQILERPPDLAALPSWTPQALRELLERCLEKDPSQRLPHIREALPLLALSEPHRLPAARVRVQELMRRAWPVIAGLVLGLVVAAVGGWLVRDETLGPVARLTVPLPASDDLVADAEPAVAISPDGRTIVYRATRDGVLQLFQRALGDAAPTAIAGSVNATGPFVSPDGQWIGFDRDGILMKVPLAGGPAVPICQTGGLASASSWSDRDEIVFAPAPGNGLFTVPVAGGPPRPLTRVDHTRGDRGHGFPAALPGGAAVLFTITHGEGSSIAAVRRDSGALDVLTAGSQPRYVSTGHLVFLREDTLWAAPFDVRRVKLKAAPVPVLRGLDTTPAAHFAIARDGSLLYLPTPDPVPPRRPGATDREQRGELPRVDREMEHVTARRTLLLVQHWTHELEDRLRERR